MEKLSQARHASNSENEFFKQRESDLDDSNEHKACLKSASNLRRAIDPGINFARCKFRYSIMVRGNNTSFEENMVLRHHLEEPLTDLEKEAQTAFRVDNFLEDHSDSAKLKKVQKLLSELGIQEAIDIGKAPKKRSKSRKRWKLKAQ